MKYLLLGLTLALVITGCANNTVATCFGENLELNSQTEYSYINNQFAVVFL